MSTNAIKKNTQISKRKIFFPIFFAVLSVVTVITILVFLPTPHKEANIVINKGSGATGFEVAPNDIDGYTITYNYPGQEEKILFKIATSTSKDTLSAHLFNASYSEKYEDDCLKLQNENSRLFDIAFDISGSVLSRGNKDAMVKNDIGYIDSMKKKIKEILQNQLQPGDIIRIHFLGVNTGVKGSADIEKTFKFVRPSIKCKLQYQRNNNRAYVTLTEISFAGDPDNNVFAKPNDLSDAIETFYDDIAKKENMIGDETDFNKYLSFIERTNAGDKENGVNYVSAIYIIQTDASLQYTGINSEKLPSINISKNDKVYVIGASEANLGDYGERTKKYLHNYFKDIPIENIFIL